MTKQDLIDEKAALDLKVTELKDFCATPALMLLELEQRCLIAEQVHHMDEYARILGLRIASSQG